MQWLKLALSKFSALLVQIDVISATVSCQQKQHLLFWPEVFCLCNVKYSIPIPTDRVSVESVGANKGDSVLQIVALDSILIVLIGDHSQGQGSHRVLAPIGQFYLQGHSVAHFTVCNDVTVTRLPIHQYIWKKDRED